MKVKMLTRAADANRAMKPGHVYDLDDQEAHMLIDGGYAEPIVSANTVETTDYLPSLEVAESVEAADLRKKKVSSKAKATSKEA